MLLHRHRLSVAEELEAALIDASPSHANATSHSTPQGDWKPRCIGSVCARSSASPCSSGQQVIVMVEAEQARQFCEEDDCDAWVCRRLLVV